MTEADEHEQNEPEVSDVPEPDQDVNETAEGEPTEDEPQPADQPPDEPPANVVTAEAWEKRFKAADKAHSAYLKRLGEIFEVDPDSFAVCPLCADTPSGILQPEQAGTTPPEVAQIVTEYMTGVSQEDFEPAQDTEQCSTCRGKGRLLTGSRIEKFRDKTCEACNGAGYRGPGNPMFAPPAPDVNELPTNANGEPQSSVVDTRAALEAMRHVQTVPPTQ